MNFTQRRGVRREIRNHQLCDLCASACQHLPRRCGPLRCGPVSHFVVGRPSHFVVGRSPTSLWAGLPLRCGPVSRPAHHHARVNRLTRQRGTVGRPCHNPSEAYAKSLALYRFSAFAPSAIRRFSAAATVAFVSSGSMSSKIRPAPSWKIRPINRSVRLPACWG